METVTTVLVLLLAVVASGSITRALPIPVPLPLIQIALGAAIAPFGAKVTLEPHLFMLLFLPPLLFLDGWRIPKEGLLKDGKTIIELALGLVVLTVLGVGLLIHWMIPAMPLAVAFALAAIVSPTDPIAVSAIAQRNPIPHRLLHIIEGESLLNDASGLVCFRFAVAAALTGTFSILDASTSFVMVAFGGLAIGVAVTVVVTRVKAWLNRRIGEEPGSQILVSILIPFGAYIAAEHFHLSGILAAVAAGVTMSYAELRSPAQAATRMRRTVVWDAISFTLSGVIFVILGEQLPDLVRNAARTVREAGQHDPIWLAVYVVVIVAALGALRFAWAWTSLRFTIYRAKRRGEEARNPGWRVVAALSVAGVRGAITLAGIMTLPLVDSAGMPFPARDLAIFLAAGVIILSLIVASVFLPRILARIEMPHEDPDVVAENEVRIAAAEAAIRAVEAAEHDMAKGRSDADLFAQAGARVMEIYRQRIDGHSLSADEAADTRAAERIEKALWIAGIKAEREAVYAARRSRKIDTEQARRMVRDLDLVEARYGA